MTTDVPRYIDPEDDPEWEKYPVHFFAAERNGYVAINEYHVRVRPSQQHGVTGLYRTVTAGIKPLKLGREFADYMNMAYRMGHADGFVEGSQKTARNFVEAMTEILSGRAGEDEDV